VNEIRLAGPSVTDLVTRARNGDQQAWDALVERYAPLIWSICRGHRLADADAGDVARRVWLQLVRHVDQVRDPAALAGWLATTTRRECLRAPHALPAEPELFAAERHAALREALLTLPPRCQELIALLIQDPPDARISATLGIPVGDIGPTRRRCLDQLRRVRNDHYETIKNNHYQTTGM